MALQNVLIWSIPVFVNLFERYDMEQEHLQQEIEKLRAENARLKSGSRQQTDVYFKVSQKGALSAYGLGRFPVTLYKSQWQRLLDKKDDILEFISENEADLKTKD